MRSVVPLVCANHLTPAFVVRRIVPLSPTAEANCALLAETPKRIFVVTTGLDVHVAPASVDRRVVPASPPMIPLLPLNATLRSHTSTGLPTLLQVEPPSVVRSINPPKLTATPVSASAKATAEAECPSTLCCRVQLMPSSLDRSIAPSLATMI